jgi:hypothetical protein
MPLVECVRGAESSPNTIATVLAATRKLGKVSNSDITTFISEKSVWVVAAILSLLNILHYVNLHAQMVTVLKGCISARRIAYIILLTHSYCACYLFCITLGWCASRQL